MLTIPQAKLFKKFYKPLTKRQSLQIDVKRIVTTVDYAVINKSLLPAAMQVAYPVYMFNEYDRKGGLFYGNTINPPNQNTKFLYTMIWGADPLPQGFFSGLNTIQNFLNLGDVCCIYTDDLQAPNYFVWIVLSTSKNSIGSVFNDLNDHDHFHVPVDIAPIEKLHLETDFVKYYADNKKQWGQTLKAHRNTKTGTFEAFNQNNANGAYNTPDTFDNGFLYVNFPVVLDQYLGIYTYMLYNTDSMSFEFELKNAKEKLS